MNGPDVAQELLAMLPPILRAIVRALGFVRAQEWLSAHGGVNIHLPKYKHEALDLTQDELAALRDALAPHLDACGRFTCPKDDKLLVVYRNHAIISSAHRDSIATQARQYNLTSRHIQNIRRMADAFEQLDLFD